MKVQSIIEHKAADEWMEGKPQSAEEVVEEDYPLMRFRGRNDLPRVRQPVRDIRSQISGPTRLFDVLLRNGGDHALASRSGHAWGGLRRKCELGCWSSSAQEWMSKEEEGVGDKGESLSLYKGGRSYAPPHLPGKLAYSPAP